MRFKWHLRRVGILLISLLSFIAVYFAIIVLYPTHSVVRKHPNVIWAIDTDKEAPLSVRRFSVNPNHFINLSEPHSLALIPSINESLLGENMEFKGNLRQLIKELNENQTVSNEELYGYLPSPRNQAISSVPRYVFVIQVHDRPEELAVLIESLRRVKGIQDALIVFSHDVYSTNLNNIVKTIRFARTVQIFFPHTIQVFPNLFPGSDPRDCPSRISPKDAQAQKCLNAQWPDSYNHYREAMFSQIKHHWIWKTNFVFEHLVCLQNYSGYVIFLEEDHYVVEDILHVTDLLDKQIWSASQGIGILALGSYSQVQQYQSNVVDIASWVSSQHNMGMAFSRALWRKIKECSSSFCNYDDYNWDWTLQHVGQTCMKPLKTVTLRSATRVYHLGVCKGIHHVKSDCSVIVKATELSQILSGSILGRLYPTDVSLGVTSIKSNSPKLNGGWGDQRDKSLCESVVSNIWDAKLNEWAPHLVAHSPVY